MDKLIEESLKILLSLAIGAIFFGLGRLIKNASNARVREVELKRDIEHLKRGHSAHSNALVSLDNDHDSLNERITRLEGFVEHSGFYRAVPKP